MIIRQLSVFLENKPGRLCAATDTLAKKGINISALTLADTAEFGIEIIGVGINTLGVPKTVTEKVFERMIAERKQFADKNLAEGKREAKEIRVKADLERDNIIANAEAEAQKLRAEGDAAAAKFYKEFAKDPELAGFLRKVDALRLIMEKDTTLVIDTNVPPFDLLKSDAVIPGAANSNAK